MAEVYTAAWTRDIVAVVRQSDLLYSTSPDDELPANKAVDFANQHFNRTGEKAYIVRVILEVPSSL